MLYRNHCCLAEQAESSGNFSRIRIVRRITGRRFFRPDDGSARFGGIDVARRSVVLCGWRRILDAVQACY